MSKGATYVRVYDDLADHPKWLEVSPAGIGLWVLSLGYCSRNLTDGYFPAVLVRRWGIGDDVSAVDELMQAGRWHEDGHDCGDCPEVAHGQLYVHGYLDHQRSRAEVAELSKARSEAGRKGGAARAKQVAKQVAKQDSGNGKQEGGKSKPDTDTDTDTKRKTPAAGAAERDPAFVEFWSTYPRKVGKAAAAKAFAKAIGPDTSRQTILDGLAAAVRGWERHGTETKFIPHPVTWLNQGRWEDQPDTPGRAVLPPPPSGDLFGNFGGAR